MIMKQNNSIKQLLSKLRKHDTVVVAISVLIALVLCGGLIYLSTPVVASTTAREYEESNRESSQQTKEKLSEIKAYLTELDKLVCENKEGIDSIYATASEIKEINNKEVNNTETNTAKDSSLIKSTITEKMVGLDKSVTEIHTSIEKTNEKITEIEKLINSGNEDNKKAIAEGFAGINEQLAVIKNQYVQIQEKNVALSQELKKAVSDGDRDINSNLNSKYNELIDRLGQMNDNMEARSKETIESFRTDLSSLTTEIDGKLADLNTNVDNNFVSLTGTVDTGFQGVNDNLNNKVGQLGENLGSLGNTMDSKLGSLEESMNKNNEEVVSKLDSQSEKMSTDISGLKTYFEQEINSVNSKLEQVFQSVSNGKSQVASALLTKGVTVSQDASFKELSDAIESIEIQVPAEVEYERHYHVDGAGNAVEGEQVSADNAGGCFTVVGSHQHDKDTCYKTVTKYFYHTAESVENRGPAYDVSDEQYFYFHCNYCGQDFAAANGGHQEETLDYSVIAARNGELSYTEDQRVLDCNITDSGVYNPGCGYRNGEIIGAHIVYSSQNQAQGANNSQP